ncbi:hypothetical protein A7C99_3319 [Trichophyton rubrum]|uniref:Uncharacterized protein n=1 Tax=Trichophyton rubrum TaxID=5551 RepID=A0A178F3H2_TRIRU|nr:hypothetical protein A7C99_3319 [Trichophyton rubrum]
MQLHWFITLLLASSAIAGVVDTFSAPQLAESLGIRDDITYILSIPLFPEYQDSTPSQRPETQAGDNMVAYTRSTPKMATDPD